MSRVLRLAPRRGLLVSLGFLTGCAVLVAVFCPGDGDSNEPGPASVRSRTGPPPGLLLIEGGDTKIGTPVEDIARLVLENVQVAIALTSETPQHTVHVEDFYLMPTEVTVEQYAAYLEATGERPPWSWGAQAVDEGRREFLEEQGQEAKEARELGIPFVKERFDPEEWWWLHWRGVDWSAPEDELDLPVVYVSNHEAQAYARWAGLRLMTEPEYVRAARGDTDNVYPWGNEFEADACASLPSEMPGRTPVDHHPAGMANGCYDLVGNVWEWTESPFERFPGFRKLRIETGEVVGRILEPPVSWDSNGRVLVGGSFQQNEVGMRIAVRMFADRIQSTDALGFRCAASVPRGLDAARALLRGDVDLGLLPGKVELDPGGAVILDAWHSEPGALGGETGRIPGYAVITGYERVLFVPVTHLPANSSNELRDRTASEEPVPIGLLSIDRPLMDPALEPGTYYVAFRAGGESPDEIITESEDEPLAKPVVPSTEAFGFDQEKDQYIFYDLDGMPLVALTAERRVRYDKMRGLATITVEPWEPPKKIDEDNPPIPMDTLRFRVMVAGKSGSKGFHFDMPLKIEPDSIDESWGN